MRALALLLLLVAAPASAAERFTGTEAAYSAGAYIDKALGYGTDYTPGRLAIDYVRGYDGGFMTTVRFSPSRGHQVVLGKSRNERAQTGAACAEFRVVVERFTAESLAQLERDKSSVTMKIDVVDTVRGTICLLTSADITVSIGEVRLALSADHAAFATPFALATGAGGGGI